MAMLSEKRTNASVVREDTLVLIIIDSGSSAILIVHACYTALWLMRRIRSTGTARKALAHMPIFDELGNTLQSLILFSDNRVALTIADIPTKYQSARRIEIDTITFVKSTTMFKSHLHMCFHDFK